MGAWIPEPTGHDGGRSPPSTRRRSWPSTTPLPSRAPGGALLRREGLYSSHLTEWRRARDVGALAGLTPAPRAAKRSPEQAEIERLRSRAERAEDELAKTKAALEVVGKAHALLELLSESADTTPRSRP